MVEENFSEAVRSLESQIAFDVDSIKKAAARRCFTVCEMHEYMKRVGLSYNNNPGNEEKMCRSVIHITGTKGKGSTCSMIESIIRRAYKRHTGMFTSPHLVKVTERIRLDGQPIGDEDFAKAYFAVRKRLLEHEDNSLLNGKEGELPLLPGYFKMITLVALFVFEHYAFDDGRGVDVTILEVGMGGRYDATNVYETSDAVGITLLDLDHTRVLGDTLEKIAWEKGGIIKPNNAIMYNNNKQQNRNDSNNDETDVFVSGENTSGVINVLKECANDVKTQIKVVKAGEYLKDDTWQVGLPGEHQRRNADIALAVCQAWAKRRAKSESNVELGLKDALASATWPGRCQSIHFSSNIWFRCDGAHTEKSVASCIVWFRGLFANTVNSRRILLFNCSHERSPVTLLNLFIQSSLHLKEPLFHEVYFCPSASERPSAVAKTNANQLLHDAGIGKVALVDNQIKSDNSWQETLLKIWLALEDHYKCPTTDKVCTKNSAADAIHHMAQSSPTRSSSSSTDRIEVLVTGSLLLVGTILKEVGWYEKVAEGRITFQ